MSETLPIRHPVNVRTLPNKGRVETFEADADARRSIAAFLDVDDVEEFTADAEVTRWRSDGVRVAGRLRARLQQTCVVTLEPLSVDVDEAFEALFVPEDSPLASRDDGVVQMMVDAEGEDPPETFAGDTLDLGAVWMEFLALAVDPFPRKPGAAFEAETDEAEPSPFAALAVLKGKAANSNG